MRLWSVLRFGMERLRLGGPGNKGRCKCKCSCLVSDKIMCMWLVTHVCGHWIAP